jgi:lysophospholipase L1-like esterase
MVRSRASFLLLTVLCGMVAALGLVETFLRVFPLRPPARVNRISTPDRGVFAQYDPLLGYDGVPDLTAAWPKGFSISLNSSGDRDRNHSARRPGEMTRVVLLGDSFVWGYDVRDGERVSDRLPEFYRDRFAAARSLEAINLAVSGYGTDQEVLKYWLKGRQYEPDAVVVGFFGGNDPLENASTEYWNCPKPRFVLRDGKLMLTGVPVHRIEGWSNNTVVSPNGRLRRWVPWSALVRLLSERELPSRWLPRDATRAVQELLEIGVIDGVIPEPDTGPVDPMAITQAIADRLRAYLAAQRIPLVLLLIPSAHLYLGDNPREAGFYEGMRRWAEANAVPYVDYLGLTTEYRSHFTDLYFDVDEHWTPLGHELAARFLGRRLEEILATERPGQIAVSPTLP